MADVESSERGSKPAPTPHPPNPSAGGDAAPALEEDGSITYAGGITSALNSTQLRGADSIAPTVGATEDAARIGELLSGVHGGQSTERYVVDREIDRGGMGAILSAADLDLRRQVAMKVALAKGKLSEQGVKRFIEEAQITGQLEHPNIVPIHELGVDANGRAFFTMKMVHGESLDKTLTARWGQRKGPLTPADLSEMLDIFLKACDGLAFAHSKGVIHRDLKPANIMVGQFGEVLVMDWGLARILSKDSEHANPNITSVRTDEGMLSKDGDVAGTPHYMPPEQAEGRISELDQRSDIYSLGAVLYEMLTGRTPFRGKNAADVLKKVSHGGLVAPDVAAPQRAIPAELSAVCMTAMAHEKGNRYARAVDLARDIRSFLDGRMVAAYRYNLLQVIGKRLWRHRWPLAAAVALVATALGAWGYTRHAERVERLNKAALFQENAAGDAALNEFESAVENYQQALAVLPADEERTREEIRGNLGKAYYELFRAAEAAENDELAATFGKLACREAPGKYDQIIQGDGVLDISTSAPAQVQLLPALEPPQLKDAGDAAPDAFAGFDSHASADLGSTPIENRKIAMGSWLLMLRATGFSDVRVPIWVGRNEHVRIENLRLLKQEELPAGMVYVPAGLWRSGAPRSVRDIVGAPPLRQQTHAGFLIGEREVTNEQWWQFMQEKMKTDRAGWSRYRPLTEKRGQEVFNWTPDDATDPNKAEDWRRKRALPVVGISYDAAAEYARSRGARPPTAEEWEVAARGADGRLFAWGNRADTHKANVYDTFDMPDRRAPGAMPVDCSPYGVLDMTGNVSEWTSTWYDEARREYTVCGANFSSRRGEEMLLLRRPCVASKSLDWVGFRIAMDLPAGEAQAKRTDKW